MWYKVKYNTSSYIDLALDKFWKICYNFTCLLLKKFFMTQTLAKNSADVA